jgi:hypothetical protein
METLTDKISPAGPLLKYLKPEFLEDFRSRNEQNSFSLF